MVNTEPGLELSAETLSNLQESLQFPGFTQRPGIFFVNQVLNEAPPPPPQLPALVVKEMQHRHLPPERRLSPENQKEQNWFKKKKKIPTLYPNHQCFLLPQKFLLPVLPQFALSLD